MEYITLNIESIRPYTKITFDLFIHYKGRYLCYIERGNELDNALFKKLVVQRITRFYITTDDEANYYLYMNKLLKLALDGKKVNDTQKVAIASSAAENAITRMGSEDATETSYKMTEDAAGHLRMLIMKNPKVLKKLFTRKSPHTNKIIKHSINVSALSTSLAKLSDCDETELNQIGVAAFLHDLGLNKLNFEDEYLFLKPFDNFTAEDKRMYFKHQEESINMLKGKPYISPEILDLILYHHEDLSGGGPLKRTELTIPQEIISLVNFYDKLIVTKRVTYAQAFDELQKYAGLRYQNTLCTRFKKILIDRNLMWIK